MITTSNRRVLLGLAATVQLLVLGCVELPIPGGPQGEVIAGSGPVGSEAEAARRVLAEYLGLAGLAPDALASVVIGTGADPVFVVYRVPNGPFAAGIVVQDPFGQIPDVMLGQSTYIFWMDPKPDADLGHATRTVYVRASDGQMTIQEVEFAPIVKGIESLYFDPDRESNLVYRHAIFVDSPLDPFDTQSRRSFQDAQPGTQSGGLAVLGAPEGRRLDDLAQANQLYGGLVGDPNAELDVIRDQQNDRIDAAELAQALRDASEGLGPDDKFFFFISSHGSNDGKARIGRSILTYADLCLTLTQNVSAGRICCLFTMCYGGQAVAVFEEWEGRTDKGVRVATCTNGVTSRWVRARALECIVEQMLDGLPEGTVPTFDEMGAVFRDLDVSKATIDQKYCDSISAAKLANPAHAATYDDYKAEYLMEGGSGEAMSGGFGPASGPGVLGPFGDLFGMQQRIAVSGTGTTNDGAALFDLFGFAESQDFGRTLTLSGTMQITSEQGRLPGSFNLSGGNPSSRDTTQSYVASGMMQVFPEGQVETLLGSIELELDASGNLIVVFSGTHTEQQAAEFQLSE